METNKVQVLNAVTGEQSQREMTQEEIETYEASAANNVTLPSVE
jgi:hypothetical protein